MQSLLYGQATTITDDPFGTLEHLEGYQPASQTEPVKLAFSAPVHALLDRISSLLRRPLDDLAEGLLAESGDMLAYFIKAALEGAGMDAEREIDSWAQESIRFESAAHAGRLPLDKQGLDSWQVFNLKPLQPAKARKLAAV